MSPNLQQIFATHQLRATKPRLVILDALKNAAAPLSITQLVQQCPSIDKVSVYRTIDTFKKTSIVTVVTHGWKQRYELAAPFRPHHHHLVCATCGQVVEIHSKKLEQIVARIAQNHAFQAQSHTFEITGLCGDCQAIRPAA